jgi:hypothetical protein
MSWLKISGLAVALVVGSGGGLAVPARAEAPHLQGPTSELRRVRDGICPAAGSALRFTASWEFLCATRLDARVRGVS